MMRWAYDIDRGFGEGERGGRRGDLGECSNENDALGQLPTPLTTVSSFINMNAFCFLLTLFKPVKSQLGIFISNIDQVTILVRTRPKREGGEGLVLCTLGVFVSTVP